MKKLSFTLLLLVISTSFIFSQEIVLTLDKVLELGLENSMVLKGTELDVAGRQRTLSTSYNVLYPSVTANIGLSRSNKAQSGSVMIPTGTETPTPMGTMYSDVIVSEYEVSNAMFMGSVSASLVINPAMFSAITLAKQDFAAGLISKEETEKRIQRDLKKNFYSLILMRENLLLMEESLKTMKLRYDQTYENYNSGLIPELLLLNTRVAYENMKPAVQQLATMYDNAVTMFKIGLGLDRDAEVILKGAIELKPAVFNAEDISVEKRFDVQNTQQNIRKLELVNNINKQRSFAPSVILSASWSPVLIDPFSNNSWENFGSSEWADLWMDNGSMSIMISMQLDALLPGSKARNDIAAVKDQISMLQTQLSFIEEMGMAEIENVIKRMEDSLANIDSLGLTVNTAERNLALTEEAYNVGAKELLDVQSAEDELRQANQNLLSEKINYLSALFDLEYLINTELFEY